jgi:hypothetical protein
MSWPPCGEISCKLYVFQHGSRPTIRLLLPQKPLVVCRPPRTRIVRWIFRFYAITRFVSCQRYLDYRPFHLCSRVRSAFTIDLGAALTAPPANDLSLLLGDVISIARCSHFPSFSVSKATILSSWVVRTQKLPKDILLPRIEDVILYLKLILEAAVRDTRVIVTVVDALDVSR